MAATLAERGSRYGSWREQSRVTQNIKDAMQQTANWARLPEYMRETLEQIANKFARILSGDFMYDDNWHDVVGYAKLAEECLLQDNAGGVEHPFIIDPDNPPEDWMVQQLVKRGYLVSHPDDLKPEPEVRQPAFLRDPLRDNLAGDNASAEE